jgi:prephenate decarboxylase
MPASSICITEKLGMTIVKIPDVEIESLLSLLSVGPAYPVRLGTLGPEGTSSEYIAQSVSDCIGGNQGFKIDLSDTFEQCLDALTDDRLDLVLVPHAYSNINIFYMHPGLTPALVFRGSTPEYGLATRSGFAFEEELLYSDTVVSHPAPIPLLRYYFDRPISVALAASTSQAASEVASGRHNIALTNEQAARQYDLKFVYRFSRIPMTWTVFSKRRDHDDGASA